MKTIFWAGVMLFGLLPQVWGYALSGPVGNGGDSWQQAVIGYGGLNAPKNLGEEFRRNTPVMFYAFDANYLGFFGSNGVVAVDSAYAVLNNLTNVSSYSVNLSEFPLAARHYNFQAQALGLLDLKSATMGLMVEQLGLVDPVQYAWTLHDWLHVGSVACPVGMEYLVVQRNFDITSSPLNQLQYSPYVNNVLYSYQVLISCPSGGVTLPYSADPLAETYSPLASFQGETTWGSYYTSLTRDDVAGLRYLLRTNNINWETAAPDSLLITATTNFTSQQLFPVAATNSGVLFNGTYYGTADLGALIASSRTNDPATLQTLFPGVVANNVSNYFTTTWATNYGAYYTNYISEPAGTTPHLILTTNKTLVPLQIFENTFANVITNKYRTTSKATLLTISVAPPNGAPYGSPLVTNYYKTNITLSVPSGDYYILPTNSPCGVDIISTLITNVTFTTNLIFSTAGTNSTGTNAIVVSTNGYFYSQSLVTRATNYVFVMHPVTCDETAGATGLYQGIENIKFVKSSYDSLIGQFFQPITNDYTMVAVTNSQAKVQHFRRVITVPDFLFTAQDLATSPSDPLLGASYAARNLNFDEANVLPNLAGPGTITTPTVFTFDKVGPTYFNSSEDVMDGTPYFTETPGGDVTDLYYLTYFVWASYDGTTNAPVVYPNGTSIDNLENQILIQLSPASLSAGYEFDPYPPVTFTATGGSFTAPYTWSATGLPSGLTISSDGTLSGTPSQSGTFVFTLTLTDYIGRSVQWNYSLTINAP